MKCRSKPGARSKSRMVLESLETRLALSTASPTASWATIMRSEASSSEVAAETSTTSGGEMVTFSEPVSIATLYEFETAPNIPATGEPFGSGSFIDLSDKLDLTITPTGGEMVTFSEPVSIATLYEFETAPNIPATGEPFGSGSFIDLSDKLDLTIRPSGGEMVTFTSLRSIETESAESQGVPVAAPTGRFAALASRRQTLRSTFPARGSAFLAPQLGVRPLGSLAALRAERLGAVALSRG